MRDARIQSNVLDDLRDGDPMKCLWMLAGVVDYKLCDRRYDCEKCPFEAAIREGGHLHKSLEQAPRPRPLDRIDIQGYEVMPDRFYDSRHSWARIEDAGSVRVGIDDFGQRLMGRLYATELPAPGTAVNPSTGCWRVAHHAGETTLTAPVSGLVIQVNPRLTVRPSLINRDPYGDGWVLLIQPDRLEQCLKQLYYGYKVEQFYERDIEKLNRAMSEMLVTSLSSVGATMQDGGSRIRDFTSLLTADQMRQMINLFLSAPVSDRSAAPGADVMGPNQGR